MKQQSHPVLSRRSLVGPVILGLCLGASSLAAQTTPLLNFTFNEGSGTTATNSGSASGANATLLGNATWSSSTTTGFGSSLSLSGTNGDYASASGSALNGLTAFTVTMWVNLSSTGTSVNDRLLSNLNAGLGIDLNLSGFNTTTGNFVVTAGVNGANAGAATVAGKINQWTFVAVRYNSALGTNNVAYYTGTTDGEIALLASSANIATQPAVGTSLGALFIGNTPANPARSPNGLFDDVRIYGTALNAAQVNAVRLENLAATTIPEPSAAASLAAVSALGLALTRRRRR